MPGYQQEALAALSQAAEFAAVVRGFGNSVTIGPQQRGDLIQQGSTASSDAGNIFQEDQLDRVVLVGFKE